MKCSKCGNTVDSGEKFCKYCGNNISGPSEKKPDNVLSIISIVFAGLSLLLGFLFIPFSIIGLILGIAQKEKSPLKTAGIILNSIGLAISIVAWAILGIIVVKAIKTAINNNNLENVSETFILGGDFDEDEYNDWEDYIGLADGKVSLDKSLEGEWRILNDSNEGFVFNDGVFYFYKDINNKEDNYITGTYGNGYGSDRLDTAKKALDLINRLSDIDLKDMHQIDLIPNKAVENGEEVEKDTTRYIMSWILFGHGNDGIEAKVRVFDDEEEVFPNDNFVKIEVTSNK